jgi:hypothetical protein
LTETAVGIEQVRHLRGPPVEDVAEDQHGALPGREVLEGGDEGQPDRLK